MAIIIVTISIIYLSVYGQKTMSAVLLYHSYSPQSLETGSLTKPKIWDLPVSVSRGYRHMWPCLTFTWVLRI